MFPIRNHLEAEQGNSLILFAVGFIGVLALAGVILDVGYTFSQHIRVQNAADAAALAGMQIHITGGTSTAVDTAIQSYLTQNGANATFQKEWLTTPADPCATTDCLRITASRTLTTTFASIFGIDTLTLKAQSMVYGTGVSEHDNLWPLAFQWQDYQLGVQEFWNATGRHFDVDSFGDKKGGTHIKKMYHKHQFDKTYGDFLDIMGFADFKWSNAMQNVSSVSIRFKNVCNAAGSYEIKISGSNPYTGVWPGAAGELAWIVTNIPIGSLEHIYLTPSNLNLLRGTQPKDVQDDAVNRDHAYTMQVFDADTNQLAFEFSIYEHVANGDERDACAGIPGPTSPGHTWSWIDFDGPPSSDTELADAICNPNTSPLLHINDSVPEIAGIQNTQAIRDCLDAWLNQEVYVPIYDVVTGQGASAELHIVGFAAFVLESYDLTSETQHLVGHFVGELAGDYAGGGPNYGLQILRFVQ